MTQDLCRELIPPEGVIEVARSTMGGIDLDPYSTAEINHVVQAARFLERSPHVDIAAGRHWSPSGGRRVLLAVPTGVPMGKALANKLLLDYQSGHVQQAILWLGSNEVLTRCPWVWDFPLCIPFSRLAPQFWDDELEETVRVPPADWSPIIYFPIASPSSAFSASLARFHAAASHYGRVVLDQWSGESRWKDSYQAILKRDYSTGIPQQE